MSEYDEQAQAFLDATGTEYTATFTHFGKHFDSDNVGRDCYTIVLKRDARQCVFKFGQSIQASAPYVHQTLINHPHRNYNNPDSLRTHNPRATGHGSSYVKNKHYRAPSAYDVLACLDPYTPSTFREFCDEFGYNDDSISARRVFDACSEESDNLRQLYSDKELEALAEIQ